jgi:hypothetical protein
MKKYPIKNEKGEIVDYGIVTDVIFCSNVAGCVIGINNHKPDIFISLDYFYRLETIEEDNAKTKS